MHFFRSRFGILPILTSLVACAPAESPYMVPANAALDRTIYVVNYAWHSGLIIARDDIPAGMIPEIEDFPEAEYIEFGWGDREYYPARDPGISKALLAGLVPTDSVVQLGGLPRSPQDFYAGSEVHALPVTSAGLQNLAEQLDGAFDRADSDRAEALQISTTERFRFYAAHGRFHVFNTCNTWAARKLAAAGVDISAGGVMTAEQLMRRVRRLTE